MDKLKACPYCGNKNVKLKKTEIRGLVNTTVYYIDCEAYACNRPQLEFYYKPEDAIEAWNSIERKEHNVCGVFGKRGNSARIAGRKSNGRKIKQNET